VVNKDWFKELVSKQFSLNGNYLIDFNTEKRVSDQTIKISDVTLQCYAKVGLKYFYQLVSQVYKRNP
jgi:hypothetical protein